MKTNPSRVAARVLALSLLAAACGSDGSDGRTSEEPAGVSEITDPGSENSNGSASASASASAPASGSGSASALAEGDGTPTAGDGGYEYVSDVSSHRLVVDDICAINELLPSDDEIDWDAVDTLYREGGASVNSDGSIRSIGGFAARDDRSHGLDEYYGTPTPLDDFVTAALDGTGPFDGEADAVRRQGVQKGIQNATMVAWVIHELNSALSKAGEGDFDVAEGAVHNWDEGWAFYHGAEPSCAPYATADSRAANFGTLATDGETALANEALLAAMIEGRDALLAEDAAGAEAAATEAVRNLAITYSQATLRYAQVFDDDIAADDLDAAKVHQAEGHAFWRVIESTMAANGADVDVVNTVYDLGADPEQGGYDQIEAALTPAWDALAITSDDIGELVVDEG